VEECLRQCKGEGMNKLMDEWLDRWKKNLWLNCLLCRYVGDWLDV
jgi:hypothetical protein